MFEPGFAKGASEAISKDYPNKADCLLEMLELAMNRDPDQEFELLLVLERERGNLPESTNNKSH